jgi:PhnB protein
VPVRIGPVPGEGIRLKGPQLKEVTMYLQPYLDFNGQCEDAIEFYKKALGARVEMLMRFKDAPKGAMQECASSATAEKIMHATLKVGHSIMMASDGRCTGKASFSGISMSLSVGSDDEATQRFNALSEGGQIMMPLAKTFFSSQFGMVKDRFGVVWMVIVAPQG